MKQAFGVSRDMAKLFKRDTQTQDCRFVEATAVCNLFQRQTRIAGYKSCPEHADARSTASTPPRRVRCFGFVGHGQIFRRNCLAVCSQFEQQLETAINEGIWQ